MEDRLRDGKLEDFMMVQSEKWVNAHIPHLHVRVDRGRWG
jgi:hypothetical protein